MHQKIPGMSPILLAAIFFILIFFFNWMGYRMRKIVGRLYPEKEVMTGTTEGALLGLMSLLLAFTFGTTATKFERMRQEIIVEANVISTAILKCKLYPDSIEQWMLPDFRQYLEARIDYFNAGDFAAEEKIKTILDTTNKYFNSIWNKTVILKKEGENRSLAEQMLPDLINMKNNVGTREALRRSALPFMVIMVLLLLVFASGFIIGYGVKPGHRNLVISVVFALMTSAVLFLIMEQSRSRQGFINLDSAEQNIVDLRKVFQ